MRDLHVIFLSLTIVHQICLHEAEMLLIIPRCILNCPTYAIGQANCAICLSIVATISALSVEIATLKLRPVSVACQPNQ